MPGVIKPGAQYIARLSRFLGPVAVAGMCLWLLSHQMQGMSLSAISQSLALVSPVNWLMALAATVISFWSLGRYDAVAHRHLQTRIPTAQAHRAGMAAIAFSQTIGFGLFSGSFARWRLTPGLSPVLAFQVTLFVTISFFVALGALLSISFLAFAGPSALGGFGLVGFCALLALAFAHPRFHLLGRNLTLPPVPAILAICFWAAIDTLSASSALYFLMPEALSLSWDIVVPVYLMALGAALISGAPGGVGPFELTALALLPGSDMTGILAGIIAFRLIYFALPAVVSGLWLLWPPRVMQLVAPPRLSNLDPLSFPAARAETGVLRQSDGGVLDQRLALVQTPQTLTALFDPLTGHMAEALAVLDHSAKASNRVACIYKCNGQSAVNCRRAGWPVLRIARDAILDPQQFDLAGAPRRQLRRKLGQAERAAVVVTPANAGLPLDEMAEIDMDWQARNGRAKGLTMGRFQTNYLQDQRVYLAWQHDRLCAYVSFHTSHREWALDLMRSDDTAADGTMHALIVAAMADARRSAVHRLSLSAVPDHRFAKGFGTGLHRFKSAFAPKWEPRYMAAPSHAALALALADLIRTVHAPPALPSEGWNDFHKEDEKFEFAISQHS